MEGNHNSARDRARGKAWRLAAGCSVLACLTACEFAPKLTPDTAALAATAPGTATAAPDCATCHAYPLHDVMHQYHLYSNNVLSHTHGDSALNNLVTCMDCHFRSVQSFSFPHPDTLWGDANGNPVLQHSPGDKILEVHDYRGWRPMPIFSADSSQGRILAARIDSLIDQYARIGEHPDWRTWRAHDNGLVDVVFPPNDVKPADSLASAYRPRDISCSSIACHNIAAATYRFRDAVRGLSGCPSLDGNDVTCGDVPLLAAKRSAP